MYQATSTKRISTNQMVKISVLAVMSFILMQFELPIPIFPNFLKLDVSDLPAIIGVLMLGPLAGILIELVKNLLHFVIQTGTGGVGELANFCVGVALVIPIGLVYRKMQNIKGYVVGAVLGIIAMAVIACFMNYYILIPAYSEIYGTPIETFVAIAQKINPAVVDFKAMILYAIAPFNLLKGVVATVVGYGLFRVLKPVLMK